MEGTATNSHRFATMAAESAIDETNLEREEVKVALMEAGAFKEIRPKEYLFRFLEKGVRPDHRTPDTTRDMIQSVGMWFTLDEMG